MVGEEYVSGLIREWVAANHRKAKSGEIELAEDADLMATGVLDSMGFIELLEYIKSITGARIDLSDLDPKDFTSIEGLARAAVSRNMPTSTVEELA
jgi:acyl carrier protein